MFWEGRVLWGAMVRDNLLALDWFAKLPIVDAKRIGMTGMSLGSTMTQWTAAFDERVKTMVSVANHNRYQDYIPTHAGGHAISYFVPNILFEKIDMEAVNGLIAPRYQMVLFGDQDDLEPLVGIRRIEAWNKQVYGLYGKADRTEYRVTEGMGHDYTRAQYAQMLDWFKQTL
jgi:dienelactone hydrolase